MTDQPLPLKPLNLKGECLVGLEVPLLMQWCDVHEKPYYACKIYELETKLAAKEAEIAMLKNSMHYRDKTHPWAKIQELEAEIEGLKAKIGSPPVGSHPDEMEPRDKTWHKERLNWIAETERTRKAIQEQAETIKILTEALGRIAGMKNCMGEVPLRWRPIVNIAKEALDRVRGKA